MSDYYRIKLDGREVSYVEAESKPKARKLALKDLAVEKLSGSEVARLIVSGISVARETPVQNEQPAVS